MPYAYETTKISRDRNARQSIKHSHVAARGMQNENDGFSAYCTYVG